MPFLLSAPLKLLFLIFILITLVVISLIFEINPIKEYDYSMGAMHGWYAPGYWIISLIKDSYFIKAPLHTIGYDIWWWPSMVMGGCIILDTILSIISTIISLIKNYQQKNRKCYIG